MTGFIEEDAPATPNTNTDTDDAPTTDEARPVRCRSCGTALARVSDLFDPRGEGAFVNPFGFIHEVIASRQAQSVMVLGSPTDAFSWFPGYAWQHLICASCTEHLGWFYSSVEKEPSIFFGFRRDAVDIPDHS